MSLTIRTVLNSVEELYVLIFQGSGAERLVRRDRCLVLANQLAADTHGLREELRRGRLADVQQLRAISTEETFQGRLAALDAGVQLACDAALDTLAAVTADDFRAAREGICGVAHVLGLLDTTLAVLASAEGASMTPAAAGPFTPTQPEGRE